MGEHVHSVLALVAILLVTESMTGSLTGTSGHDGGLYFHFQNISSEGNFEAGHMRGNPGHWISRHEEQHGHANKGSVQWSGSGSGGLRVWDLKHVQDVQVDTDTPQPQHGVHTGLPDRKSGGGHDTDCFLHRLVGAQNAQTAQRRSHKTLITRDCSGNPLAPPGIQLSPGTPRPPTRPRSPPTPPPSWRPAEQTLPPQPPLTTDVYLQKRGGRSSSAPTGVGVFVPPRGFEPTAEEDRDDQEVQEDHLRGMKHADKQLMFGDGSYQAASSQAHVLRLVPAPSKMKSPFKSPFKLSMPIAIKVSPIKGAALKPVARPARPRPMVARLKPMVVMVRPMSSNRLPTGGKGPVDAAKPLPIRQWLTSMWGGG